MKRLLSTIITVAVTAGLKAQLLALKTDALWDGLMTPNLGMEIVAYRSNCRIFKTTYVSIGQIAG